MLKFGVKLYQNNAIQEIDYKKMLELICLNKFLK